jgi:hypothetical protein
VSLAVADEARAAQAEQIARLLDLWTGLALQHVALGGACACGAGGVSLRLEDFELDIVDYLHDTAARSDEPAVADWGRAAQRLVAESGEVQRMRDLFAALQRPEMPEVVTAWLLPRLDRTLQSYAQLHGPRGET